MPETDGVTLAAQIRDMARYYDTPILMLTAMSEKQYIDAAFTAGATDYVTKPFEVAELKARLGLVERAVETPVKRNAKIFAAKAVTPGSGKANVPIDLYEPVTIYDIDNLIGFMAMENYIRQLSRNELFGSTAFAFSINKIASFHSSMTPFEFYSVLTDVAEVISDTLEGCQFLMSYAGHGTFVCITESGWHPEPKMLANNINLALSRTELYDNHGNRIEPRVSAGNAERLMWKTALNVMDAISAAHASAEANSAAVERTQNDFWSGGRMA